MIAVKVNGVRHEIDVDPATPLLYVLRSELGLNGARFGCGLGQCGACTILLNGQPVFSCLTPIADVGDGVVTTVEGLGSQDQPGIVQQAFAIEQAAQCGYCIAGMIMRIEALLRATRSPAEQDIRDALDPSLCRCGTHMRILRAARRAVRMKGGTVGDAAEAAS